MSRASVATDQLPNHLDRPKRVKLFETLEANMPFLGDHADDVRVSVLPQHLGEGGGGGNRTIYEDSVFARMLA